MATLAVHGWQGERVVGMERGKGSLVLELEPCTPPCLDGRMLASLEHELGAGVLVQSLEAGTQADP